MRCVTRAGTGTSPFVDGHAKAVKMRAGYMSGAFNGKFVMVRDVTGLGRTAYCSSPDPIINTMGTGDQTNVPLGLACGDVAKWVNDNYPPCAAGSTSNCSFTD